jgi:hypothetical protein
VLALPAAEAAIPTWIQGFGFSFMPNNQQRHVKEQLRMLIFPGTELLSKQLKEGGALAQVPMLPEDEETEEEKERREKLAQGVPGGGEGGGGGGGEGGEEAPGRDGGGSEGGGGGGAGGGGGGGRGSGGGRGGRGGRGRGGGGRGGGQQAASAKDDGLVWTGGSTKYSLPQELALLLQQ